VKTDYSRRCKEAEVGYVVSRLPSAGKEQAEQKGGRSEIDPRGDRRKRSVMLASHTASTIAAVPRDRNAASCKDEAVALSKVTR
jgi:hypothetical protein